MPFYYAGFNARTLLFNNEDIIIDCFTEIPFSGITNIEIGWSCFLVWREKELYISRAIDGKVNHKNAEIIQIPGESSQSCKKAAIGRNNIVILSTDNVLWQYKFYENSWKRVPNFIPSNSDSENEYPVKVLQGGCTVVLTNLGRVFNVPTLLDIPKRIKFVDIACGFDHTILLADNGDVYSMGMGTRGQLGHNDLEDCDNPRLVEALAGLKVVQIAAGGWHSAVITDQGDLYTWGWNTKGELGILTEDAKVLALPTLIDLKNERGENVDICVKKVQCGNSFTVCMTDDGALWGCGSNKYGQLGQSRKNLTESPIFVKLNVPLELSRIKDFQCREWGTVLVTD